jgi:hypothetical protein
MVRRRGKALRFAGLQDGKLGIEHGLDVDDEMGGNHGPFLTLLRPSPGLVNPRSVENKPYLGFLFSYFQWLVTNGQHRRSLRPGLGRGA